MNYARTGRLRNGWKFGGAMSVVFGGLNSLLEGA